MLGFKGRIEDFKMDLHQRMQQETIHQPGNKGSKKVYHKRFYQAEIDAKNTDLRIITARFEEPEKRYINPGEELDDDEMLMAEGDSDLPDNSAAWVDLDDYNDVNTQFEDRDPSVKVLPGLYCPRLTYYRQTGDVNETKKDSDQPVDGHIQGPTRQDTTGSAASAGSKLIEPVTKFGKEPSHLCLIGCADRK